MTSRILITGGGGAGSEALFRLLSPKYEVHFADADPSAIDPGIPTDRCHKIPMAEEPLFVEQLARLCQALDVALLIPAVDEELEHADALRHQLPPIAVLAPQQSFIDRCLDKLECAQMLQSQGVAAPASWLASDQPQSGGPWFVKPRSGRGSRGIWRAENAADIDTYIAYQRIPPEQVLVQELLSGTEYTVFVAADRSGALCAVVPVLVETKRGITIRARVDWNAAVIEYCTQLHNALHPSGCYNVQLIASADGDIKTFEINPRISTTLCMSVALGADPIQIYREGTVFSPPASGLTLRRHWQNHLSDRT